MNKEEAVSAYIKFLQAKGLSPDALEVRTKFINNLVTLLSGKNGRAEYKHALATILKVEDAIEHHQQLNLAREFYPFWVGDFKTIARMGDSYGLDLSATEFRPMPAFLEWPGIEDLNNEKLDDQESLLLDSYSTNLQKQHLADSIIHSRMKLVKIVLLRLRDIPIQNNIAYRMAVEVTLPLFNLDELKQNFLEAVREFFYIWIAKIDPAHLKA